MPRVASPVSRAVRIVGIATIVLFAALVVRFWHPVYGFTQLLQLDASNDTLKLAPFRELPVYVYRDTGGYDGLYYAQIALDPSLRNPGLPAAIDDLPYRSRRILPPAVAWLLGAGQPAAIIRAYSVLNIIAWFALAALLWRVLPVHDARTWFAWAGVLLSAGALCCVRLALTDLPAATLIVAGVAAAERGRKRTALGSIAASALSRETSLLGVAGLVKPPWISAKNAIRIALAALPLALWLLYIRGRFGSVEPHWGNLTVPFTAFVAKWRQALTAVFELDDLWLTITTVLATFALTVQALFFFTRPQLSDRWWRVGASFSVLLLCLGMAVWEGFPGAATRVLLPLTIAFNVVVARNRASWVWLIAGNLGIFAGLLAVRDVPHDPTEIAATARGNVACIAHARTGWYEPEASWRHTRTWASNDGKIELETWPRTAAMVHLEFGLRAMSPRTVALRVDAREVWHANVGTARARYAVDVEVESGHAVLDLTTDVPAVKENNRPDSRYLGFALYDFTVSVPQSRLP